MSATKWSFTITIALAGCAEAGRGHLEVLVEAEDTIIHGIEPGEGDEHIGDGWAVGFDRYVVVIGDIEVQLTSDQVVSATAPDVFAIDLTRVDPAGEVLWRLEDLRTGDWEFGYSTPGAGDGARRHDSVDPADFARMQDEEATYLVAGTLSRADGRSCPPAGLATIPGGATPVGQNEAGDDCYAAPTVALAFSAPAETVYGPCEIDGQPGFSISDGGSRVVAATIHGDHLFFNGFPEGGEGGTLRLAQWWADCDLDLDGQVTKEELQAIAPSDLPEIDARYQLGGSPITPLTNMWDYVRAQLKTQGHFQGEGECPADGTAHEP